MEKEKKKKVGQQWLIESWGSLSTVCRTWKGMLPVDHHRVIGGAL